MTTGELIRQARISAGLTQKELGERAGIAEPTIGRYELGKLNPKPSTLKKIANALGISWVSLLPENIVSKSDDLANYELVMEGITRIKREMLEGGNTFDAEYAKRTLSSLQDISEFLKKDLQGGFSTNTNATTTNHANILPDKVILPSRLDEIIKDYKALNSDGQQVAVERVHELTEIPRYQRKVTPEE